VRDERVAMASPRAMDRVVRVSGETNGAPPRAEDLDRESLPTHHASATVTWQDASDPTRREATRPRPSLRDE
jgi:hypothetical protein